jgi:hypothetical protein
LPLSSKSGSLAMLCGDGSSLDPGEPGGYCKSSIDGNLPEKAWPSFATLAKPVDCGPNCGSS